MSETSGVLYVVATPIGNLGDIGTRAGRSWPMSTLSPAKTPATAAAC